MHLESSGDGPSISQKFCDIPIVIIFRQPPVEGPVAVCSVGQHHVLDCPDLTVFWMVPEPESSPGGS